MNTDGDARSEKSKSFAIRNEILVALLFFIFFMIFQVWFIHIGEYWDAKAYVMPFAEHVYVHFPNPFITDYPDPGHPTLIYVIVAVLWKFWGLFSQNILKIELFHVLLMFCSAMNLYYVYRLGKYLVGLEVGLISALLIFFNPIYFSQSTQISLELPLTLFTTACYFYYIIGRRLAFTLTGAGLLMTKGYAVLFYLPIILAELHRTVTSQRKGIRASDTIKSWMAVLIPLLVLLVFILARYSISGVLLSSEVYSHHRQFAVSLYEFVRNLYRQMRFTFSGYGVYYIMIPPLLYSLVLLLRKVFKKESLHKADESDLAACRKRQVIRLVFLYVASGLLLAAYLALVNLRIPRYYFPFYTPLFILATYCTFKMVGRRFAYCIFGLILVYSLINLHPRIYNYLPITFMKVHKHHDISLGDNLEYIDNLMLIKQASEYIKENYAEAKIIGDYPFNQYLYGMDFEMPRYPEIPELRAGRRYIYILAYVPVYNAYLKDEFAKQYTLKEVKTFSLNQARLRIYEIDTGIEAGR